MCVRVFAVHSFVDLAKYLLSLPDVTVFLSNRLCQDPLENFLGQQRQRGHAHEYPTAQEFFKNTQALRVIHVMCSNVRGNCRASTSTSEDLSSQPLPNEGKQLNSNIFVLIIINSVTAT